MKKVLAWVLALALVLSTFAMSFATYTDEAAQKEANCEGQVAVLSALGVITGYPDGEYKPANVVTRAEMAALVIRAMGFSDVQTTGYETGFSDVPKEAWCSGVVKKASDLGLVKGYPDGSFKPSNTVTYNEALTMIVRALGYKEEGLTGSWPQNYVNQARTLDLAKDVTVDERNFQEGATRGDCAIMIYNALELPMVSYDKNGFLPKDDTFLERLEDLLKKDVELNVKMIVQMCDIAKSDVLGEELLGAPITAMTFDGVVAAVQHVDATLYDVDDLDMGKATNPDYSFRNGYITQKCDAQQVWATVKGNYADVVSAIEWDATQTKRWTENDAKILKDKNELLGENFIEDENDEIDVNYFFLKGVDSLDKIAENNIVTIYTATPTYYKNVVKRFKGKEFVKFENTLGNTNNVVSKVEVGTKTIEGTVSKTKEGAPQTPTVATIDGTDYDIAQGNYCVRNFDGKIAALTGTAYLNYKGQIADFSTEAAAAPKYALVLDSETTRTMGLNGPKFAHTADLFTAAGEEATFGFADDAWDDFDQDLDEEDLIAYAVDENGANITEWASYNAELTRGLRLSDYTIGLHPSYKDEDIKSGVIDLLDDGYSGIDALKRSYRDTNWYNFEGNGRFAKESAVIKNGELLWTIDVTSVSDVAATGNKATETLATGTKNYSVDDDVVLFSKESYDPEAAWTVTTGIEAIDGYEFKAGTQFFFNDGVLEAIKCDYCIGEEGATYALFESADLYITGQNKGFYEMSFFDLGEKTSVEIEGGDVFLGGIPQKGDLVYVSFDVNGDVSKVERVNVAKKPLPATFDAGEAVGDEFYGIDTAKADNGVEYIVADKNYNVTGATVYRVKADNTLEASTFKDIINGANVKLLCTVSGANAYNIVIWEF